MRRESLPKWYRKILVFRRGRATRPFSKTVGRIHHFRKNIYPEI
jgi:hypothetical protein